MSQESTSSSVAKREDNRWNVAIRVTQTVILLLIMPWGIWVTNKIYELEAFKNQGPRFTVSDAEALKLKVRMEAEEAFRKELESLRSKMEVITLSQNRLEVIMTAHMAEGRPILK